MKVSDFGWAEVKSGDEVTLQQATALDGPMSVRIDASSLSFYLYKGGKPMFVFCLFILFVYFYQAGVTKLSDPIEKQPQSSFFKNNDFPIII